MEACSSSQYWARQLQALGHTVRLMDLKLVKPFVRHNKSNKADAEGIYHAVVSGVRSVSVNTNFAGQTAHSPHQSRARLTCRIRTCYAKEHCSIR